MRVGNCRHFNGYQNGTCKNGINYRKLVGGPDVGWAARLPCVPNSPLRRPPLSICSGFVAITEEENKKFLEEVNRLLDDAAKARAAILKTGLQSGVIECPKCNGKLHFSIAHLNRHIHARCASAGCLSWAE